MVFVDTSAWFAFFLPVDPHHKRVLAWLASSSERLVTTDFVVDETLTLLLARGERRRAHEAGKLFFEDNAVHMHFVSESQVHRAWIVFHTIMFPREYATGAWFTSHARPRRRTTRRPTGIRPEPS